MKPTAHIWTLISFAYVALSLSCAPSRKEFFEQVYPCDRTRGPDGACGKNARGEPMTCFSGKQLGGQDFCTDACSTAGETAEHLCTDAGAKLRKCRPSADADKVNFPNGACGHAELSCLRTDLLADEGVCIAGRVCSTDQDCGATTRGTCASTLVKALLGGNTGPLRLDHLQCVQAGCKARGAVCSTDESCLPALVPEQSRPADVCVPHCDSRLNCPPNHLCYRKISGPASPDVCLAGLPSFRCNSAADCLLGACTDIVDGLKICTLPCTSDLECAPLALTGTSQVCAKTTNGTGACVSVELFGGSQCTADSECSGGARCVRYSPYGTSVAQFGYCLLPCDANNACRDRAGVPHSCHDKAPIPVCYPGKFGLPCSSNESCLSTLQCRPAQLLDANDMMVTQSICTLPCATDADCSANRHARPGSAQCKEGVCVLPRRGGRLCATDRDCVSGECRPSTRAAEAGGPVTRCTRAPGDPP
jgi:hypothetical protein